MEACSVTVTGTLAYEPRLDRNQQGDPRLTLMLRVACRANRTRWIKVKTFGLLAVRSAESYHKGDRVTVRGDDLDSWGRIDDRPADGSSQSDGPRVQSWVYITAYDIALSTANDTATSGQTARRAAEAGDPPADRVGADPGTAGEQADREVFAGATA